MALCAAQPPVRLIGLISCLLVGAVLLSGRPCAKRLWLAFALSSVATVGSFALTRRGLAAAATAAAEAYFNT